MGFDPLKTFYHKIYPYYRMLRITEQCAILVGFFFGVLDSHFVDLKITIALAIGLLCHSISIFVLNEFIDARDTDKYSQKTRVLAHTKVISWIVFVVWIFFLAVGSFTLLYFGLIWQNLALIILNIIYSIPPFRTKAKFAYDVATVYAAFIFIPYSLGFSLNHLPFDVMLTIPFFALTAFLGVAEGVHFLGDLEADRKGGLHNTSVVLGYQNLIKLLIIFSFGALIGFTYLVYQHTHWWYYPLLFFAVLAILALGYARGNLYNKPKLVARFTWATKTAISFGNYLFLYQLTIIWLIARGLAK